MAAPRSGTDALTRGSTGSLLRRPSTNGGPRRSTGPTADPADGERPSSALPPTPVLGLVLPSVEEAAPGPTTMGPPTMSVPALGRGRRDALDASRVTIGVVLEIPEPWAKYLQRAREGFGDRQARAIPTHVTLLPPTTVPRNELDDVAGHLSRVARALHPFEILLEGTDTFRPVSPVVFIKVARGGEGCDTVQRAVRTGRLACDLSFPFHPHVTVAHHLDDDALDRAAEELSDFSIAFTVSSFVLYEHGSDEVWRPRRRFRFGSQAT